MWTIEKIEDPCTIAEYLPDVARENIKGVYYAAYTEGRQLAGIVCVKKRAWHTEEIRHLYVLDAYRHRGASKALIARAFAGARDPRVIATIHEENEPSLKVFQAAGFERIDTFINKKTRHFVFVLRRLSARLSHPADGSDD